MLYALITRKFRFVEIVFNHLGTVVCLVSREANVMISAWPLGVLEGYTSLFKIPLLGTRCIKRT